MATSPERPQAFPKRARIRKRAEYLLVQGRGRKFASPHLLVFTRKTELHPGCAEAPEALPGQAGVRIGITVSKKVGIAVARNRVKRRLREVFRRHKGWFPPGRDVVIVARPGAAEMSSQALEDELEKLCARCFPRP